VVFFFFEGEVFLHRVQDKLQSDAEEKETKMVVPRQDTPPGNEQKQKLKAEKQGTNSSTKKKC
jgi:hypothetical protein